MESYPRNGNKSVEKKRKVDASSWMVGIFEMEFKRDILCSAHLMHEISGPSMRVGVRIRKLALPHYASWWLSVLVCHFFIICCLVRYSRNAVVGKAERQR